MENLLSPYLLMCLAFVAITAPFLAFLLSLIFKKVAPAIGILSIGASFIASLFLFLAVWKKQTLHFSWHWVQLQHVKIDVGILLNDLTVIMLLMISLISLLVHIYSVEYMRKDVLKYRYFAYLSLFCFAMLGVVLADNLFILYAFWELVGFASYLLIGFWFTRDKAVQANKKAMIMNRIGDVGFLIGLMILLTQFHTLDLSVLFGPENLISSSFVKNGLWVSPFNTMPDYWLTIAGFCFFAGAIAKSAQFPLHTWLPDAMEGPTAVSSLIHAATMVAAGVFLLLRIVPLFNELVLTSMAIIGLFTAFMAATIALTQSNIKKVLAFSTISQLGFMILAVGVGDNAAAIFHLITHAFFKCLLFLTAGAVIHELHHLKEKHQLDFDEQNLDYMGGLRKFMPITGFVFLLAACALSGLPFTSGYLSKDAILISVFQYADVNGGIYWLFPLFISITSWLTTFYIFRVVFKVFFGKFRLSEKLSQKLEVHEASRWMTVPILILGIFCFGFFFAFNPFNLDSAWLYKGFNINQHNEGIYHLIVPLYINMLSIALIFTTYYVYAKKTININFQGTWFYKFSYNQWYFNSFYDVFLIKLFLVKTKIFYWFDQKVIDGIVHFLRDFALILSKISSWIDKYIIDGLVNGVAALVQRIGIWLRGTQNGKLQHYFIWMLFLFLSFMIYKIIL
ncbi:MAG: NADH-quinone oxidoreductase subunit L [Bacteroidetes bacterium]|nr:NADH-quinone oxidoreductase subunit L [Bacteroidota bacterium]MBU1483523.1 NADH-quinone oxidoreductase subunit L [Bacteroidota bacterium]MBU2046294.1 NADH-quinone oxidoreductase subunit L [Bacteroidota bacterium]MBU2269232.1 NADH-quinone oxidoreductase subunit L [Bacteroidota bacterium]MBU2376765.1 NADH-quinone oxidoreductase subunit L [Bacteroidota bacterium]